ncbi:DUF2393 domain-containing protein [Helicobacter marmotae]|uniref:DUF2393 domain-containing protein n=1 Tax=Helicobacter marmotae TaxID=152490 RepID=A0A3D8I3V2_9HELI|nr:DUF2393 domain-containing protein [Helicobacter marmotae]RDU59822.1 DUF2393 domain-containing protein [Helicobacter marmotae]
MIEDFKALLIQMLSYISLYELALLLALFFVFIMIFTLGLLLRGRRFIAEIFFFLSAGVICAAPFVLHFVMKNVFYTTEVNITSAHAMQYTKGFFVSGEITHKGKIPISQCYVAVNEVRDESGSKIMNVINSIFPKSSSGTFFNAQIAPGGQHEFAIIVPHFEGKEPFLYRIYIDCYLSNQFAHKIQDKHITH